MINNELIYNKLCNFNFKKDNKLQEKINLTENELKIFLFIKKLIKSNNLNISIWVTGGWVRDKILNIESKDIDIVIKGIKSSDFVLLINKELYPQKYNIKNINLYSKINLTKTSIFGNEIDFIDLIENDIIIDSKRRNLTINSIYYNIIEDKIEDITKKGINDLKNGFLQSPCDLNELFYNDVLTIMKILRFSSKFNFKISNDIHNNIFLNKDKYKQLIYNKIPKERIQKEFEKIFNNPNPHIVIYSLYKYDLLSSFLHLDLFKNPNHLIQDKDLIYIVNLFLVENYLIENYKTKFNNQFYNDNFYIELFSTLLILIFRNFTNDSNIILSKLLLSHLFGQNVSLWKITHNLIIYFDEFKELKEQNLSRLKLGIYLRKIKGNNLIKIIFISLSNEYVEKFSNNKILNEINKEKLNEIFKKYYEIYEFVDKENLFKIDELKPILNGKDILNYFPETQNKQMKFLINILIEEQIKTKNTLSRNEAFEILKNKINK